MRPLLLLPMTLAALLPAPADAAALPVVMRDDSAFVAAAHLEREVGIVAKRLPGRDEFVVCGKASCAALKGVISDGEGWLVPVTALSAALSLTANFDERRTHVTFIPTERVANASANLARVGALMPNLRLKRLDGAAVTLDELRGQRVLINSWASW